MTFTLPASLQSNDDDTAVRLLTRYFVPVVGESGIYTGAAWDDWDPSGRREQDVDEFTADDCMAVTLLSVNIPGSAAHSLLVKDRARYSVLLADVGPDRDLVEVGQPITGDWPASVLYSAVRELPGIGGTKTSKLLARKRPALLPIWAASSSASRSPVTTSGSRCDESYGPTTPPCTAVCSGCVIRLVCLPP